MPRPVRLFTCLPIGLATNKADISLMVFTYFGGCAMGKIKCHHTHQQITQIALCMGIGMLRVFAWSLRIGPQLLNLFFLSIDFRKFKNFLNYCVFLCQIKSKSNTCTQKGQSYGKLASIIFVADEILSFSLFPILEICLQALFIWDWIRLFSNSSPGMADGRGKIQFLFPNFNWIHSPAHIRLFPPPPFACSLSGLWYFLKFFLQTKFDFRFIFSFY